MLGGGDVPCHERLPMKGIVMQAVAAVEQVIVDAITEAKRVRLDEWFSIEDATQEAILEMLEAGEEWTPKQIRARAWTIRRESLYRHRSEPIDVDSLELATWPELPEDETIDDSRAEARSMAERVLSVLPEPDANALWAVAKSRTIAEAAFMLNMSQNALTKRLKRIRERFQIG